MGTFSKDVHQAVRHQPPLEDALGPDARQGVHQPLQVAEAAQQHRQRWLGLPRGLLSSTAWVYSVRFRGGQSEQSAEQGFRAAVNFLQTFLIGTRQLPMDLSRMHRARMLV